jgi:protein-S-isoprenylcysteine O-methyltransferase Ste14
MLIFLKTLLLTLGILNLIIRKQFERRYKITHQNKVKIVAPVRERMLYLLVMFAFVVPDLLWVFSSWLIFAQIPMPTWVNIIGVFLGFFSLYFFYQTHQQQGDNWSGTLEIKQNHQLVTKGIYQYIRHPMYASFLLNSFVRILITANWMTMLPSFLAIVIMCFIRIPSEEKMMLETFGEDYHQYMQKSKRLIPFVL